jgi:hypothetical protein
VPDDGKEGNIMAIVNREGMETLVIKAKALRTIWLLAREERLAEQLAANVEVRREWMESDSTWASQDRLGRFANAAV